MEGPNLPKIASHVSEAVEARIDSKLCDMLTTGSVPVGSGRQGYYSKLNIFTAGTSTTLTAARETPSGGGSCGVKMSIISKHLFGLSRHYGPEVSRLSQYVTFTYEWEVFDEPFEGDLVMRSRADPFVEGGVREIYRKRVQFVHLNAMKELMPIEDDGTYRIIGRYAFDRDYYDHLKQTHPDDLISIERLLEKLHVAEDRAGRTLRYQFDDQDSGEYREPQAVRYISVSRDEVDKADLDEVAPKKPRRRGPRRGKGKGGPRSNN